MQFLKIIFWILVLIMFSFLAASNWHNIPIVMIPNQTEVSINLPLLLAITFLIGFLPYYILHKTTSWSLRKKLSKAKRELEETKHVTPVQTPQEPE